MSGEKISTGVVYIDGQPFEGDPNDNPSFTPKQQHLLSMLQSEVQRLDTTMMIDTHSEDDWVVHGNNTRDGRIITHTSEW